jgi:hypothetical protein
MSKMKDLFGDVLYDVEARARTGDPDTSHEAPEHIDLREKQRLVLVAITKSMPKGLTLLDIEDIFNDHGSTYRSRVSELVKMGLVRANGHRVQSRPGKPPRNRVVWIRTGET